jgi:hypothetical protein
MMTDDMELVREYAARQTESAFAELVSPLLDEAPTKLGSEERDAVVLMAKTVGSVSLTTIRP